MGIYYIAGLPYSDELWHHGIKGQKWGIRRYENEDGTLTPLGKIRYGTNKAARAVGTVIKNSARRKVMKFKAKHPWMMSDEEIVEYTKRLTLENNYKRALEENRKKNISKGKEFAKEVLRESGKKLIYGAIDRQISKSNFKLKQRQTKEQDRLSDRLLSGGETSIQKVARKLNPIFDRRPEWKKYGDEILKEYKENPNSFEGNDKLKEATEHYKYLRTLAGLENDKKKKGGK